MAPAEDLLSCGGVGFYDRAYDRVSTKTEKPLPKLSKPLPNVTTTDDPNIRDVSFSFDTFLGTKPHFSFYPLYSIEPSIHDNSQLSKKGVARVFATDSILATLMTCTRSVYSWDLAVHRVKDMLFFDKRDGSAIGLFMFEPIYHDLKLVNISNSKSSRAPHF